MKLNKLLLSLVGLATIGLSLQNAVASNSNNDNIMSKVKHFALNMKQNEVCERLQEAEQLLDEVEKPYGAEKEDPSVTILRSRIRECKGEYRELHKYSAMNPEELCSPANKNNAQRLVSRLRKLEKIHGERIMGLNVLVNKLANCD